MESNLNALDQLTKLQEELGYIKGNVSIIAMLGLLGEAGEVLGETIFLNTLEITGLDTQVKLAIDACRNLDESKKLIRKMPLSRTKNLVFNTEQEFDAELADVFYYVNILATNRGLTINDLAQMAHDKVRAKQAAGGSSEDRK